MKSLEKQVQEWVSTGTVTPKQGEKMLSDVKKKGSEDRSNKLIIAISTIGALFLGIGALLFVAANWDSISDPLKIMMLAGSTFGAYIFGYIFKYGTGNLPKVGASLLFLGALLFGATIALIAQIYHIQANAHSLVLVWLLGVLPLVYAFRSTPIAVLSSLLFFVWIGLYLFRGGMFDDGMLLAFPTIYLAAGALLFGLGGVHYFVSGLEKVARVFRIIGVRVAMFSLFLLTFEMFSGSVDNYWLGQSESAGIFAPQVTWGIILFGIVALISLVINLMFNPASSKLNTYENSTVIGVLVFTLLLSFFGQPTPVYTLLYNLIFAGLAIVLLIIGYQRSDMKVVNMGIFWLAVFTFAKYFDFFWGLMDRALFFLVGGLILVIGGIVLENKRRKIKESFAHANLPKKYE